MNQLNASVLQRFHTVFANTRADDQFLLTDIASHALLKIYLVITNGAGWTRVLTNLTGRALAPRSARE